MHVKIVKYKEDKWEFTEFTGREIILIILYHPATKKKKTKDKKKK